ncbi:replication initiator [Luedemannella helvata]|uniref:Plasmid replication initiator protein n=1 Tax=Luedemannella helvata TaxID=349315 RepID=A0ABN2L7P0_9ACTN
MTVSTLTVAPEANASGAAPAAEPDPLGLSLLARSSDLRRQAIARAIRDDFPDWLENVKGAATCTSPIRLAGTMTTVEAATGRLLSSVDTATMPDGVLYKPCGNRRETVCPSCSKVYQRDAYEVVRTGLLGGKGVPERVSQHPAIFTTHTAPSFGEVHTRRVPNGRHTCADRKRCDCRPDPCHARRDNPRCEHGRPLACFARHDKTDRMLGTPLCLDCYDHDHQVVWNIFSGELWRRTKQAADRYLGHLADARGIPRIPKTVGEDRITWIPPVRIGHGKVAELQARAAVHFHSVLRLDGIDPDDLDAIVPPPAGFTVDDLHDAMRYATMHTRFRTRSHPDRPGGWVIAWGEQYEPRTIALAGDGSISDSVVAGYLAKYATKSTEATGHLSGRLTPETVDVYADPDGDHIQRLIDACWRLGRPTSRQTRTVPAGRTAKPVRRAGARWTCPDCDGTTRLNSCPRCTPLAATPDRPRPTSTARKAANRFTLLRRWAHMLGYGGHFLTKSSRYSITFRFIRDQRITFRRNESTGPSRDGAVAEQPTVLVVNFLQFVGAGWQTPADAMLATTSAALAREHQDAARQHYAALNN